MRNESGNVKGNIPGKQEGESKSVIFRQNLIEEQSNDKELARFQGMAGYCRSFCLNFSEIAAPLTNLLSKR